jgi:hypothetical protein
VATRTGAGEPQMLLAWLPLRIVVIVSISVNVKR